MSELRISGEGGAGLWGEVDNSASETAKNASTVWQSFADRQKEQINEKANKKPMQHIELEQKLLQQQQVEQQKLEKHKYEQQQLYEQQQQQMAEHSKLLEEHKLTEQRNIQKQQLLLQQQLADEDRVEQRFQEDRFERIILEQENKERGLDGEKGSDRWSDRGIGERGGERGTERGTDRGLEGEVERRADCLDKISPQEGRGKKKNKKAVKKNKSLLGDSII